MAWYRIAENVLDAIADAINAKTGHTAPMTPVEMVSEIQSIQTGGADISPYKIVQGTITPSENTTSLSFPCGNITTALFLVAKVVDYNNYISADNEGMGLGRTFANYSHIFNRTWISSIMGQLLSVYNGAFDYWTANPIPTIDTTNQIATFSGRNDVTFKAGIQIEYMLMGV